MIGCLLLKPPSLLRRQLPNPQPPEGLDMAKIYLEGQCFYCGQMKRVRRVKAADSVLDSQTVWACRKHLKGW